MDPLPPELPPRAPLDEPDGRILGGGGASLGTPFAETPDATGVCTLSLDTLSIKTVKNFNDVLQLGGFCCFSQYLLLYININK